MELHRSELKGLFELLARKTGKTLDRSGFGAMSSLIGYPISQKYLYSTYRRLQDVSQEFFNLQDALISSLLNFLDFGSYDEFAVHLREPIPAILKSCEGSWMSYVRENSSEGVLLASPVRVCETSSRMYYQLKGGSGALFSGEILHNHGCLFTNFRNDAGKQFHHTYKVGAGINPRVIQGIYSGVSSANEPIGGRTVLVRQTADFEKLINRKIRVADMLTSAEPEMEALAGYFQAFRENNLRLKPVVTLNFSDLKDV